MPTAPLTRPLPPNRPKAGDSGGEEKMGWNADPGRREGGRRSRRSCPSLALGYFLMPFQGSQEEATASCRCTSRKTSNLHKPLASV